MASSNPQPSKEMESLMCSLCLDVFEEATLLGCGHTFCRKCLKRYDQCHSPREPEPELISMLCPLCRQETNLGAKGVAGLPANVSLNHLVEEFNDSSNPLRKLYDDRPRCSQCGVKPVGEESDDLAELYADAFCCDCDMYMCEGCLISHKKFEQTIFRGHQVMPVKELMSGIKQTSAVNQFDKCSEHVSEAREFYCADCRAVICHKCTIVKHNVRDHTIRERVEVEREFREKIAGVVGRCEMEKDGLEALIRETEQERRSAKASLQEVHQKIDRTFAEFHRQLEERKETLTAEVGAIGVSCDRKLDSIKMAALKMSSQVSMAQDIMKCRKGISCLEGDALVSHEQLLTELEEQVETTQNLIRESQGVPRNVKRTAARVEFHAPPMDIARLGRVAADRKWGLVNEVELPYDESMHGLAVLSPESVLIGYHNQPADEFSLDGSRTPRKLDSRARDVTVLSDGRFAVIPKNGSLKLFDADGNITQTYFKIPVTKSSMKIHSDGKDQIYVAYWDENLIHVFSPDGGDPIREINVSSTPHQVHTTKCGRLAITSDTNVKVMDEHGIEITLIKHVDYSYPAVDKDDNLYIAEIHESKSTVTIKRYTLDGELVETILDDVKIKIPQRHWYYMKCPSPDDIVFCTAGMMYVFKNAIDFGL